MLSSVTSIIQGLGSTSLFISMFLEGSSLPFPGIIIVLVFGYLLHPDMQQIFWLSVGMGLAYSAASYIPYAIGRKLGNNGSGKFSEKLVRALQWFRRYGELSVCVTRPFVLGNYISYAAGMSRVKPWRYGVLTFFGIFPWAFLMLVLGRMYHSSTEEYGKYLFLPIVFFLLFGWTAIMFFRKVYSKN